MVEFVRHCLGDIIGSFFLWIPIFLVSVLLLDFLIFRWIKLRLKKLRSSSKSRRIPLILVTAVIIQIIIVPLLTISGAILFSIERGVADALEQGSPVVINSCISIGEKYFIEQMGISTTETVLDVKHLRSILDMSSSDIATPRHVISLLSSISVISEMSYTDALRSVVHDFLNGVDSITWGNLIKITEKHIKAVFSYKCHFMAQGLRTSSLTHATFFAITVLIFTLITVSIVLILSRAR